MVTTYDPIRAEQERIENEMQNARAEFERKKPQPQDNAQVRAHKKSGHDRIRASAKADQDIREKYQARYTGGVKSTSPRPTPSSGSVGSGWILEGNYGTRADANIVRRNLKSQGFFVKVTPKLKDGSYNVWKKEGATVKSYKLKLGKKGKGRGRVGGESGELAPPTEARWVDFGTLPEYKPPNFQLDKSGYKPLDYHPLETKPMFQYTGFKTMDYKPISSEAYYKPSEYKPIGGGEYYKKSEYVPIGQFGVKGNWGKKRKRKSKAVRIKGV